MQSYILESSLIRLLDLTRFVNVILARVNLAYSHRLARVLIEFDTSALDLQQTCRSNLLR